MYRSGLNKWIGRGASTLPYPQQFFLRGGPEVSGCRTWIGRAPAGKHPKCQRARLSPPQGRGGILRHSLSSGRPALENPPAACAVQPRGCPVPRMTGPLRPSGDASTRRTISSIRGTAGRVLFYHAACYAAPHDMIFFGGATCLCVIFFLSGRYFSLRRFWERPKRTT